jgi:hypothetical protein
MASGRPTRTIQPSAKLISADNGGDIELSFHRKAITTASATVTATKPTGNIPLTSLEPNPQRSLSPDVHVEPPKSIPASTPASTTTRHQSTNLVVTGQSTDDELDDKPLPTIKHFIESEPESDSQPTSSSSQKKTKRTKKRAKVAGKANLFFCSDQITC